MKGCPTCGNESSKELPRSESSRGHVRDWKCSVCGTVWRPRYPKWQSCTISLIGLALFMLTGLALLVGLVEFFSGDREHFAWPMLVIVGALVAGSAAVVWHGLRLAFSKAGKMAIIQRGTDWSGKYTRLAEEPGKPAKPRPSRKSAPSGPKVGGITESEVAEIQEMFESTTRKGEPPAKLPRDDAQGVPAEWPGMFTLEEYKCFDAALRGYFTRRGIPFEVHGHTISIDLNQAEAGKLGLTNVSEKCKHCDPSDWPQVVADHFDALWEGQGEQEDLRKKIRDYSAIEPLLAVRLYPEDHVEVVHEGDGVHREDLEGTVSVLVFDLPHVAVNVRPEDAAHWNKTDQELFDVGLSNVRSNTRPENDEEEVGPGVVVKTLFGDSFYIATLALMLDDYPDYVGTYGSLLAVPVRDQLLCHPIEDVSVTDAMDAMFPAVRDTYEEGPGSVSPHLYWYDRGKFIALVAEDKGCAWSVRVPEEFQRLLDRMADG